MKRRTLIQSLSAAAMLPATNLLAAGERAPDAAPERDSVFELRVYHCYDGKLPDLLPATANWKAFSGDPEWQSVQKASEANGKIVEKVDSTFLVLMDFSPTIG